MAVAAARIRNLTYDITGTPYAKEKDFVVKMNDEKIPNSTTDITIGGVLKQQRGRNRWKLQIVAYVVRATYVKLLDLLTSRTEVIKFTPSRPFDGETGIREIEAICVTNPKVDKAFKSRGYFKVSFELEEVITI